MTEIRASVKSIACCISGSFISLRPCCLLCWRWINVHCVSLLLQFFLFCILCIGVSDVFDFAHPPSSSIALHQIRNTRNHHAHARMNLCIKWPMNYEHLMTNVFFFLTHQFLLPRTQPNRQYTQYAGEIKRHPNQCSERASVWTMRTIVVFIFHTHLEKRRHKCI